MNVGKHVHGERVVDGDATALTALTLYESGSGNGTVAPTTYTLDEDHFLVITDVYINDQTGGDFALVADSEAAGRYIAHGNIAANGVVSLSFNYPYACPRGVVPKFAGSQADRSICLIEGYVQKA